MSVDAISCERRKVILSQDLSDNLISSRYLQYNENVSVERMSMPNDIENVIKIRYSFIEKRLQHKIGYKSIVSVK